MFDNQDFELSGKNNGLDEWEVKERDALLKNIKEDINHLMSITNIDLPTKSIMLALSPGYSDCILYTSSKPVFGITWVNDNVIPNVKSYIIKAIKEKAFYDLKSERISSRTLKGSSKAIVIKLIIKNVLSTNHASYLSPSQYNTDILSELNIHSLHLPSEYLIAELTKEYENKHMRYRLWNEKALSTLADYLFFDYKDEREDIQLPAMSEEISDDPLSKEDLIAEAQACIHSEHDPDGTEVSYPFHSKSGYIFSEYLPLELAENSVKDQLYEWYLTACKNDNFINR